MLPFPRAAVGREAERLALGPQLSVSRDGRLGFAYRRDRFQVDAIESHLQPDLVPLLAQLPLGWLGWFRLLAGDAVHERVRAEPVALLPQLGA